MSGIPGWEDVGLREICLPVAVTDPRDRPEEEFSYIDISSIDRTAKRIVRPKRLLGADAPSRARQAVVAGDILFSTVRPNLQAVAQVTPEFDGAVASTGFCVLRPASGVLSDYVFNAVLSDDFQNRVLAKARGVSYPAVRDADVLEEVIPLPSTAEQGRIVGVLRRALEDVEAGEAAFHRAIEGCGQLRAVLLSELNADTYPRATVGELGEVFVGATPSRRKPELWGGDIPWVSSGEVAFCRITRTAETLTEEGLGKRATRLHPPGTVLIAMIGEGKTRGQAAILDIAAAHNQNCASIRLDRDHMLPEFLYYCLMGQYERNRQAGSGSQQPALNGDLVRAIEVPCPGLSEQARLVARLERDLARVDAMTRSSETSLASSMTLRRAMRSAALRGELAEQRLGDGRVNDLLESARAEREERAAAIKAARKKRRAVPVGS